MTRWSAVSESGPRIRPELSDVPAYKAGRPAPDGAFKVSSNENPYPPLPSVLAVLGQAAAEVNRYPDFASTRLVRALADRFAVPVEDVAVGTGSVGVAQQLVQAVAGDGDEVVFAWRSFEAYPIISRVDGATAVTVPLTADDRHDLPAMAAALTDRTRLVFVCNPNNPTGTAVRGDELRRLPGCGPAGRPGGPRRGLPRVRSRPAASRTAWTCTARTPTSACCARSPRRTGSRRCGWASSWRTRTSPALCARRRCRSASAPWPRRPRWRRSRPRTSCSRGSTRSSPSATASRPRCATRAGTCPPSQANFVWLRLGERTAEFAAACAEAGVVVRPFDGEGVRVTVAEPEASDLFLTVAAKFAPPSWLLS